MPTDDSSTQEESASQERSGEEAEFSDVESSELDARETSASESSGEDGDKERVGPMLAVGIFTALGFELAAFVFCGLFVGNWIDQQVGSSPAFMLVFVVLACLAAGWHIYRIAERYL